jgi:hypothetical protein
MDEKIIDKAVDCGESYPEPQGSTSLVEEPSPRQGQEDATTCTICQTWADIVAEHIIDVNQDKRVITFNEGRNHSPRSPPFHPNLSSMVHSARAGCPFCMFLVGPEGDR